MSWTTLPIAASALGEIIAEAFGNLVTQGQRSLLALLGIVIGTASVVAMLTIGHMAQRETLKLFADMGVDLLQIQAAPTGAEAVGLDRATVENLPRRHSEIVRAAPMTTGHADAFLGGRSADLSFAAVTPAALDLAGLRLAKGRFIAPVEDGGLVAVLGSDAAAKLSAPAAPVALGDALRVNGYVFTVIGILAHGPYTALHPTDFNNAVLLPLGTAPRVTDRPAPNVAMIRIRPETDTVALGARLQTELAVPGASLTSQSARQLIDTMNAQKAVHARLLAAIGAISLLVGGIGVMNVMLMGVLERRREIGLRAALGANPFDLQLMFLIEAAALSLTGGVAGALMGVVAAAFVARISAWTFSLPLLVIPLGAGVATVVGVGFGLHPAIKASRLDPIEALRAD